MADDEDDFELEPARPGLVHSDLSEARRKRDTNRRAEAMSALMAGVSYEMIAERMGISPTEVTAIITRALREKPATGVDLLRDVENARLDRAQSAIWTKVLAGDYRAIQTFLSISQRRAKLNGLDAPLQIEMSHHVKMEMQQALSELQNIVLGEVISDDSYPFSDADEDRAAIERGGTG